MACTDLIPAPRAVEGPSRCGFLLDRGTTLYAGPGTETTERWLRSTLGAALGLPLASGDERAQNSVTLVVDEGDVFAHGVASPVGADNGSTDRVVAAAAPICHRCE